MRPEQKFLGLMLALVNGLFRPKVSFTECLGLFRNHFVSFRSVSQISVSQVTLVQVLISNSGFRFRFWISD